ncbi:CocE/NonD family hydrolase [Modestobacter altitudinis]|uniref:CocE/NonD family hydrolase n=1 Tax=Modestobacter altitudinis TaxID=2213158 RepID=UPI00110C9F41|nr:CocE/NonD family hydrolase [Modestobacter altitudinis]
MTTTPHPSTARPRTRRGKTFDAALNRLFKLPRATSDYTVTRGVRVPMRDGVELLGDHYAPTSKALGTLLVRGPYGRSGLYAVNYARLYAQHGYHVLFTSSRGTFGSGGTFRPMVDEVDDGVDTLAWLREQSWFGGRLVTVGLSYLGFTQWAMLTDPPPELVGAIVIVGPHDFTRVAHGTGAFTLNDFLGWSDMVADQEKYGPARSLVNMARAEKRLGPVLYALPLREAGERHLGSGAPWYGDWVSRRDLTEPFWRAHDMTAALDRVTVPVHLVGGWQDLFLDQTLEQYARLHERGQDVSLTVGPWVHVDLVTKAAGLVGREALAFLGEHLAETGTRTRPSRVRVYVTGADEWRDLPGWPPATTGQTLYLQPGNRLGAEVPADDTGTVGFTYDPVDPTPTVGGRLLSQGMAGRRDDRTLAERGDVLAFTGPVLTAPLEVLGVPVVELAHTSDNPHADLFVRISEVDAEGDSRNVSDGFVRLDPAAPAGVVRLPLDAIAHRFPAGSRIRLLVAGGSHPRFERNLGTGEDPATSSATARSRRTITLAGGASTLVLPVTA